MRKILTYKLMLLFTLYFISIGMISESIAPKIITHNIIKTDDMLYKELLYDNIWGTIYNAETKQCDNTPAITGDGSTINLKKASQLRWIAISQDMLNNKYRQSLLVYERTDLYKGKIQYGDTVWIESPHETINGLWVVRDTKNVRYVNSIDFLQTNGDKSLYNNDPQWSGKFENIKIYKINGIRKNS